MDETRLEMDSTGERESSVCFETINNNSNENPPQESDMMMKSSDDALGKALSSTLSSVIKDFDSRAQNTLQSQDQLGSAIHRLTQELDQLLEDAPLPFIMQHAAKISGVRKRVSSLNSLLKSIQRRVDNIDRMLSVGIVHEKEATESS